jgi:hypothetical protein
VPGVADTRRGPIGPCRPEGEDSEARVERRRGDQTSPDPVPLGFPGILLTSNNEFTPSTTAPGFTTSYVSPSDMFLLSPAPGPATGTYDITLPQTVNRTVTCMGCLHVG